MKKPILVSLLAIAIAASAVANPINLIFKPETGKEMKYKATFTISFGDFEMKVNTTIVEKFLAAKEGSPITVEQKYEDGEVNAAEEKTDIDDSIVNLQFNKDGSPKAFQQQGGSDDDSSIGAFLATARAFAAVILPEKAVKVGDAWEGTVKAVKDLGDEESESPTGDLKGKYTLVALEKVQSIDCAKIGFVNDPADEEAPEFKGNVWVDLKSGVAIKIECKGMIKDEEGGETGIDFLQELSK